MIWLLLSAAHAASLSSLAAGDLVISEVHSSPAAVSVYRGQWFEVYNASGDTVDLSGLVISDGASRSFTVSGTLLVSADDRVLFATRSSSAINGGLPTVDYVYSTTQYSLSSGNEVLTLSYGSTIFDTVSFGGASFPDPYGASISLSPALLDASSNDTGDNWCLAASLYGDGDYGTPGAANDDCPSSLSALSAGDLVITEVMHDPAASDYNKGEWFEIYNASGVYIDLDGLIVDSGAGESLVVSGETLLRSGEYAIFAARSSALQNGGLPTVDYRYIYGTELTLKDTDSLTLSYGVTTLDEVSWNPSDYAGGSGVSNQLNADLTSDVDNDDSTSWCVASAPYGDGDYGSPGAANTDCTDDSDGDGYDENDDCDDSDAAIHPAAVEICDGIDNDCSSLVDDSPSDGSLYYADLDYDFYGDAASTVLACTRPSNYRTNSLDCDDSSASVNPGAAETCDGTDNNCSGDESDASDAATWYADGDGDTYGDPAATVLSCSQPGGSVADDTDCDDTLSAVYPGAAETCDGTDSNCSGDESDASDASTYYADLDHDFYGDAASTVLACTRPSGYRTNNLDCDDSSSGVNPRATETCDGTDSNCSGDESDASDVSFWYADSDGDGYGDADASTPSCTQPSGLLADNTDCDDTLSAVYPGAAETCDGTDSNCSGDESDASDASTYYADLDHDFYGDAASTVLACTRPSGYRTNNLDCDDGSASVNPGAEDICNDDIDQDCDGEDYGTCDATLAEVDGQIYGASAGDQIGGSISSVGDLTGDSTGDFTLASASAIYLFDGAASWAGEHTTADADVVLTGGTGDVSGGDINGDGYDDLFIGSPTLDAGGTDAGGGYVVYGPLSGTLSLTSGADATLLGDSAGDTAGSTAIVIGDVNNDGLEDLLLTAYGEDTNGSNAGAVYLMFGPTSGGSLSAVADAIYTSDSTNDYLGRGAAQVGDVDADGALDVLINAYREDRTVEGNTFSNVGATYLLTGFTTGTQDIAAAATATIFGENALDQTGSVLADAGDIDGDGYDDVLIASWYADPSGRTDAGEVYLLYGPLSGDISVTDAQARFPGAAAGDAAGRSVVGLGDINGDSAGDVLIGAKLADEGTIDGGAAYMVLGPLSGTIDLSLADTILSAEASGDRAGMAITRIPDQDDGGQDDVLIGATLNSTEATGSGAAYLLFTERW